MTGGRGWRLLLPIDDEIAIGDPCLEGGGVCGRVVGTVGYDRGALG